MALLDNSTELNQKLPKNTKQKRQKKRQNKRQNKKRQTNFFLCSFIRQGNVVTCCLQMDHSINLIL